jgi:pyruvate ferredoxin oxidoreductase delta subunit
MAKWDITDFDGWKTEDFPVGMVGLEAGNARDYVTGGWRSERPVWTEPHCQHCMMCWVICPDSAILVKDEKMVGINFDHCKGCGVCVGECRFNALKMVPESSEEVSS